MNELVQWWNSLPTWAKIAIPVGGAGIVALIWFWPFGSSSATSTTTTQTSPLANSSSALGTALTSSASPSVTGSSGNTNMQAILSALTSSQQQQSRFEQNFLAANTQAQQATSQSFASALSSALSSSQQAASKQNAALLSAIQAQQSGITSALAANQSATSQSLSQFEKQLAAAQQAQTAPVTTAPTSSYTPNYYGGSGGSSYTQNLVTNALKYESSSALTAALASDGSSFASQVLTTPGYAAHYGGLGLSSSPGKGFTYTSNGWVAG